MPSADTKFQVLHDHYKESFAYIREREKQRDRLFLILVALFGLLAFEVLYPTALIQALPAIGVPVVNAEVDVRHLPMAVILSTTWVFVLAILLRYGKVTITIERQYAYLHKLEEKISSIIGDAEVYRREGRDYEKDYPMFSWWVWRFYTVLFPALILYATIILIGTEWKTLDTSIHSKVIDSVLALGVLISISLYRIVPFVREHWFSSGGQINEG